LDRRRFLKYAGATAAVVGASALGLDCLSRQTPSSVSPTTLAPTLRELTATSASSITSTSVAQLASLEGRLFFDYNGNGVQDGEEPAVQAAKVLLKDNTGKVIADAITDSAGDYELEDIKVGSYGLYVETDRKFRYMCTSVEEFREVTDGYDVLLNGLGKIDIGLMEGFLTLPFLKDTKIEHIVYVDLDFEKGYRDWMGNDPNYFKKFSTRGTVNNHLGTDFYVREGSPVVSSAPGKIIVIENSWPNQPKSNWLGWGDGNSVIIEHGPIRKGFYGPKQKFYTIYCHLKEAERDLEEEQFVSRGDIIGSADRTGDWPPGEPTHVHFQLDVGGNGRNHRLDPYRDLSDSNSISYWTKDNDPQYPSA